jgi:hypothetical protein
VVDDWSQARFRPWLAWFPNAAQMVFGVIVIDWLYAEVRRASAKPEPLEASLGP